MSLEQKLNTLCETNIREHGEIKDQIKINFLTVEEKFNLVEQYKNKITIECAKMFEDIPKTKFILWVFSGVFAALLLIGSFIITVDNKIDAWYRAIKEFAKNKDVRDKHLQNGKKILETRWLEDNIDIYAKLYA